MLLYIPTNLTLNKTNNSQCFFLFIFHCRYLHSYQYTITHFHLYHKGKSVPLQAWIGPEGSRKLRFPDFVTTAQDGGKVVSLTHNEKSTDTS